MKADSQSSKRARSAAPIQPWTLVAIAPAALVIVWVAFDGSLPVALMILFSTPIVLALWALGRWAENARARTEAVANVARLEDVTHLKSDLMKTVSHELRTPLTVLGGYVDMLAEGSLGDVPPTWTEPLQQVRVKVQEVNRLVRLMLDAARAEGGTLEVRLTQEDLGEVVEAAVKVQEIEARATGHAIHLARPAGESPIVCDRDKLLVVLRNLLENAMKYSPPGADIELGSTATGLEGVIWVADRGIGIPNAEKASIFDEFHRVSSTETAGVAGTGLGLFIARSLLEAQGGRIMVADRPGGGTVFTCYIPTGERSARAAASRALSARGFS